MSANIISKKGFMNYLKGIAAAGPNEPFCQEGRCPLAQYVFEVFEFKYVFSFTRHYNPLSPETTNQENAQWMTDFIENIDALDLEIYPFFRPSWSKLSAHQCLEALGAK